MEDGAVTHPETGSPQGGVISVSWRKWLLRRRRAWCAPWNWFRQLLARYPLPYLRAIHSVCRGVANGQLEEPNALVAHVRVCGSPGRATARGHPVEPGSRAPEVGHCMERVLPEPKEAVFEDLFVEQGAEAVGDTLPHP